MRLWTLSFLASLHLNFLISLSLKKRSYGSFSESSELNVYWTHLLPIRDRRAPLGTREIATQRLQQKWPSGCGDLQPPAQVSHRLWSPGGDVDCQALLATCAPIRAAQGHSEEVHHPMQ